MKKKIKSPPVNDSHRTKLVNLACVEWRYGANGLPAIPTLWLSTATSVHTVHTIVSQLLVLL